MNGTTVVRRSVGAGGGGGGSGGIGAGGSVQELPPVATLVVYKDDAGYGMKVSGDNPVYVQSVKDGGAAARAGLHAGDTIIKVNGVNVTSSTHTEVVQLIKSSTQVVLTVQQKSVSSIQLGTQNQQQRPTSLTTAGSMISSTSQSSTSLHRASTAPAGNAPSTTTRITGPQPVDLEKKRQLETQRVHTFQLMLEKEQSYVDKLRSELAKTGTTSGNASNITTLQSELHGAERRVRTLQEQLTAITTNDQISPGSNLDSPSSSPSSSLNKHQRAKSSPEQLSNSPIVLSPSEASRRLILSESMNDLSSLSPSSSSSPPPPPTPPPPLPPPTLLSLNNQSGKQNSIDIDDSIHITPPGTPPPPYPQPCLDTSSSSSSSTIINDNFIDNLINYQTPTRASGLNDSGSGLSLIQQPIMSMEDDDMSDQEVGQLEDHGPFKSLSRLWEHHAHLSVFINYVLSNSDPSSLLFYLITDLYKEGNAKEMRKWAYEIHSSFLVPCAPLRLNNVDESVACEIDDVLTKESDKEEILRKIFWKARARAKEELNEQLADFQQKRTAGLGMLFGPSDIQLDESETDKTKEYKIIETYLLPKMEPYIEDIEKDPVDTRQLTTAAGLATILTKIFQIRSVTLDHVPTFVAKDKSNIKTRLLANKNRKMVIKGHHFSIHQYYTVTSCNQCDNIIGGIGPQGYQCCDCSLSFHRQCVRTVDDVCPGPNLVRKERANDRLSKFMERIRPERKPPSSHHQHHHHHHHHNATNHLISSERMDSVVPEGENGEFRGGGASGNTRGERGRASVHDHLDSMDDPSSREDISEMVQKNISTKPKGANINRSESYKERIHHRKQMREKRKTSDPNLSKTNRTGYSDCEVPGGFPGNSAGSSSNSSLSTRSLDSPSTSLEQVHPSNNTNNNNSTSGDSDIDVEADTPDWSHGVSDEVLSCLTNPEKKRQEVINELFHTEKSHVRALKVLSLVFHKPLLNSNVLPLDQIELLFSNLDEMISIHSHFNQSMKRKKNENPCVGDIGELLLDMFDGENGETFERAASKYCAKQQVALDALRDRRRKDTKLNSFLNEMESNPMCRRLQLKDHIPTGMLRLTKYPLLLENLAKYTPETNEKERASVLRAWERSKEIVSLVNQAVRETEDCQRLNEILRMIDRSAFDKFDSSTQQEIKNLDITKRTLIYEGSLQLRMLNRPKPVDLHVVLMDDTILLLQKQEEKYLLKFMNTNQSNSVLSPIVKISTVLVRNNAVDKNSLYLVNTSQKGAQIYDLVASTPAERKLWNKHISEAAEAFKAKNREGRRSSPSTVINDDNNSSNNDNQSDNNNNNNSNDKNKIDEEIEQKDTTEQLNSSINQTNNDDNNNIDETSSSSTPTTTATATTTVETIKTKSVSSIIEPVSSLSSSSSSSTSSTQQSLPTTTTDNTQNTTSTAPSTTTTTTTTTTPTTTQATITNDIIQLVTCTQTSLIDPIEVHSEIRPVHIAEPVLTPIECLRRKDDIIKNALIEKQLLVADILNIPKEDFEHVADMASEPTGLDKEPTELILAAISQTNQLMSIINSGLNITETEAVLAARGNNATALTTGCDSSGCPIPRINQQQQQQPSIPVVELQPICHSLTSQLSQLLEIIKEREEERERLRKELRKNRERLHAFDIEAQKRDTSQLSLNNPTIIPDNGENLHADCNEDLNKDEFVDACTDPEMIKSQPNNNKMTSSNQVMGDSVG